MNPDPLQLDDEPWPTYPEPRETRYVLVLAAIAALVAVVLWRKR